MEIDYIIVGCGLAGIAFCEQLKAHSKTFVVINDHSQQSSIVAGGVYNPVILKRFSEVWKAGEQLQMVSDMYSHIEAELDIKIDYKMSMQRRFASVEEQNEWFHAIDKPNLESYLSPQILKNSNSSIDVPFGLGEVLHSGRIDTAHLIESYILDLKSKGRYIDDTFHHDAILFKDSSIFYQNIKASYIVFAEGFGMVQNPYFKHLPLNVAKGEVITIKAPDLKIDFIFKAGVFVMPIGQDCYTVGATYNWNDKTNLTTEQAKNELVRQAKQLIHCDFEVVNQVAGIRPTVKDRRPLIGRHPEHPNLAIINGLGTRGVMIAPYVAKALYENLEYDTPLERAIDIKRFS